jgi:NAD(P)-dependent dehydrogenase (short-subunit alcohol dehydrogenase family)
MTRVSAAVFDVETFIGGMTMRIGRGWLWAVGAAGVAVGLRRMFPSFSFSGKVVLITGSSRGLGLVLARQLGRRGARLALCARDAAELERARAELTSQEAEVLAVTCDVSDPAQAASFVSQALERYGNADVLINNAGIIQVGPLDSMGVQDFREAMDINYFGAVYTTLAALPHLRGGGRIVNVCSIGGAVAIPHMLPYVASKYAEVGFSEGLTTEAARYGIKVTTVLPFIMRTGSHWNALFKGRRDREVAWFALGASLPFSSVAAERAARRILRACERSEVYVSVGVLAKAMRLIHGIVPGFVDRVAALVNRLLPDPGGAGAGEFAEPGWLHRPSIMRGPWARLGDEAARKNREIPFAPRR